MSKRLLEGWTDCNSSQLGKTSLHTRLHTERNRWIVIALADSLDSPDSFIEGHGIELFHNRKVYRI